MADPRIVAERMMDEGPEVSSGAVVMIEASEVTSGVVVMIEASEVNSRVVVMAEGSQVTSEAMLMADESEGTSKAMMMAQGPVISRANVEAGCMDAGLSELESGELMMTGIGNLGSDGDGRGIGAAINSDGVTEWVGIISADPKKKNDFFDSSTISHLCSKPL